MFGYSIDQSVIVVYIFFSSFLSEVMQFRVVRGRWISFSRFEFIIVDVVKSEEKFALKVYSVVKVLVVSFGFTCGGNISFFKMLEVRDFDFISYNRRGEEVMRELFGF